MPQQDQMAEARVFISVLPTVTPCTQNQFDVSVFVCVDVVESHAVSPNKLSRSFCFHVWRDCLLTRWVTMQRDSSKSRLSDSYFQFVATPAESDRVTTDTQFLSCSLAGRKCWKWSNRLFQHLETHQASLSVATDREVWCVNSTTSHDRGRPWRYSVIPSTPDFPTEYQIRLNSNPAGLPVIAANWGPGFRARTIILTHMFKQIKQSRTPDARLTKWSTGIGNLYATTRNMGSDTGDCGIVYSARGFSCLLLRIVWMCDFGSHFHTC